MKYVIIGGSGFLGFHLSSEISKLGFETIIVDNFLNSEMDQKFGELIKRSNVHFYHLDAATKELESCIDSESVVLNLAAINGTDMFYSKPFKVLYESSLPSLSVPFLCSKVGVRAYYYFGSSESYAGSVRNGLVGVPTPEETALMVENPDDARWSYATAKILGEVAALNANKEFGIPVGIFRLHNIYGPRMKTSHVIPDLVNRFLQNNFQVLNCSHTRTFMFVEDAVKAISSCIQSEFLLQQALPIVNIGSDNEVTILELAKRIMKILSVTGEIICVNGHRGSVERRLPNIQKMRSFYKEAFVTLDDGLARTILEDSSIGF
jgi:UDP-glucose 4-epimerase